MPSLAKILLPVDFSERSAGAAFCVQNLSARCHSEIIFLHVLPPLHAEFGPDVAGAMLVDVYRSRSDQAQIELNSFLPEISAKRIVSYGDPAVEIVRFAHAESIDLIAMPTHGYGPFRRFILGSSTAKVLHDADCPVWTGVHMEQFPAAPAAVKNILCGVDLGPQSAKALAWATWLQRQFQARLTLLHAVAAHADSPALYEAVRDELLHLQRQTGADAELLLETGEPARAICAAAARTSANVVVIGRGSAAGDFGRLRTNSYAIIRQSPCPVVSV
jgi:nucleotide-binding universal stress UspA family protein